jgi:hypothetical protein
MRSKLSEFKPFFAAIGGQAREQGSVVGNRGQSRELGVFASGASVQCPVSLPLYLLFPVRVLFPILWGGVALPQMLVFSLLQCGGHTKMRGATGKLKAVTVTLALTHTHTHTQTHTQARLQLYSHPHIYYT